MIIDGITIVILFLWFGYYIFGSLKQLTTQHHLDMDNTYKIFLRRADQRACIFWYEIEPTFPSDYRSLVFYDTPAGTLYTSLTSKQFFRARLTARLNREIWKPIDYVESFEKEHGYRFDTPVH